MSLVAQQKKIEDWVEKSLDKTSVQWGVAGNEKKSNTINFQMIQVAPAMKEMGGSKLAPLHLTVSYLVTASSDEILTELMFAAMNHGQYDIQQEVLTADMWLALDLVPRAAFVLKVRVSKEIEQVKTPIVRTATVQGKSVGDLFGTVYGPNETPIRSALLELIGLNKKTKTDRKGFFRISGIPSNTALELKVKAKGVEKIIKLSINRDPSKHMDVHINLKEIIHG